MGKAIVISGTPGVGKTAISKRLAELLKATYINLSEAVIRNKLYSDYDSIRASYVIDEVKVKEFMNNFVKNNGGLVIIDSHYGELIDDELLIKIFVLRLKPKELLKRLRSKYGSDIKVYENVEAEILGICTSNALREHPTKVCEIDVTNKGVDEVVNHIIDVLEGKARCIIGIDWLSDEETTEVINQILRFKNTGNEWF